MDLPLRIAVDSGSESFRELGPMRVGVRRRGTGVEYSIDIKDPEKPPPSAWRYYMGNEKPVELQVSLALPASPVVVFPETPVFIEAGADVEAFVELPGVMTLSLVSAGDPSLPRLLEEVPLLSMGRTWLGSAVEGRLCLSLVSRVKDSSDLSPPEGWLACPIRIRNSSTHAAQVQKLVVLCPQLSLLHEADGTFVTNATVNTIQRDGETSFAVARDRLRVAEGRTLISRPRNPDEDAWWKRGIDLLQRISSYG